MKLGFGYVTDPSLVRNIVYPKKSIKLAETTPPAHFVNDTDSVVSRRPQLGYVTEPVYQHLSGHTIPEHARDGAPEMSVSVETTPPSTNTWTIGPEKEENVRKFIKMVQIYQGCGYKYIYIGAFDVLMTSRTVVVTE